MNEPRIHFVGNLTADPELRFTPTGRAVVHLPVAVNPRHRDQSGQWVDDTPSFWTCQAWGSLAENLAESVHKGDRVLIDGRVRASAWTPTDGEHAGVEQRRLDVIVDEIGLSVRFHPARVLRSDRTGAGQSGAAPDPDAARPATAEVPF